MVISKYGFIVKGRGYQPDVHRTSLKSSEFETVIVGVERPELAIDVAKSMREQGVQLIELCGGFEPKWAEEIMRQLDNSIPVGHMSFNPQSLKLLKSLEVTKKTLIN